MRLRGWYMSDDAAREIERVGAFVDEDGVGPLLDDGAQHAERSVIVHRRIVVHQPRRHFGDVVVLLGLDRAGPFGRRNRSTFAPSALAAAPSTQEPISPTTGATISTLESISFGSMSIWMNFFRRVAPRLALAVREQPIEPRADQHARRRTSLRTVERAAPAHCGCVSGQAGPWPCSSAKRECRWSPRNCGSHRRPARRRRPCRG